MTTQDTPYAIESLSLDTIDAVAAIDAQCFPRPWRRSTYQSELSFGPARYVVALDADGSVCGFAGMWVVCDEAHVTKIAVDPRRRRCGVGRRLLSYLIELANAEGCTFIYLEVAVGNTAAQNLYHSLGFVTKGIRSNYYASTGEDALVMDRTLTPNSAAEER